MKPKNLEDIYELTPAQQGILFDSLYAADPGTYLVQSTFTLRGVLNREVFKAAWKTVVERNAALRTSFYWEKLDKPMQVVRHGVAETWYEQDWRGLPSSEQQIRMQEHLRADRAAGIDLSRSPLVRFAIFQLQEDVNEFVMTSHHLILDGWSKSLVLDEVFSCYESLSNGLQPEVRNRRPYRDFIVWLQGQDLGEAERYWRAALRGISEPTLLPDFGDSGVAGEDGSFAEEHLRLTEEETAALIEFGRLQSCTLYTLILGAWALLLSRYSSRRKVIFGTTVAGRPSGLAGFEQMIGLFINTLPTIVEIRPEEPVVNLLRHLQREQAAAREYDYTPLGKVRDWSELPRSGPLFETLLVFENYPSAKRKISTDLTVSRGSSIERATLPLSILISPLQQIYVKAIYDTNRFNQAAIRRMLGHYRRILNELTADPQHLVGVLPMLSDEERNQIVVEWNATGRRYTDGCFHQLFGAQAKKTPAVHAVAYESETLTYAALEAQSNQAAHYLRSQGVGPEVRVGLCIERGPAMIVSMLGIWKAGGVVVPLDPGYPAARLAYIISDSDAQLLVTQGHLQQLFPGYAGHTICPEAEGKRINQHPSSVVDAGVEAGNLAYVIYTSGSTGYPKGVAVEHRGLCNVAEAQREFRLQPGDRMLQFASLSFDASVFEISMALTSGATLVLLPQDKAQFGARLFDLISSGQITAATLPPSVAATLPEADAGALRVLTVAGEVCPPDLVRRWSQGRRFWNLYGPTEFTIWATAAEYTTEAEGVTIGKPISNTATYVLDPDMGPVPIGVAGELCLSGLGLARGYLGRPDLTAERFIPNPFSETAGERMYRTGDRAKLRANGEIEFLGRCDEQVKVRGFRIELGEIEATLERHPNVSEAVVVVRSERGDARIAAYWKTVEGGTTDADELRRWIGGHVPAYMVPENFVRMTDWPLTPNGKIDRNSLPAPQPGRTQLEPTSAPQTELERSLAEVWQRVLAIPEVSLQDNFFDLGGNSLLALRLFAMLRPVYGDRISIVDIFAFPNIRALAGHLSSQTDQSSLKASQERASYRRALLANRGAWMQAKGQHS